MHVNASGSVRRSGAGAVVLGLRIPFKGDVADVDVTGRMITSVRVVGSVRITGAGIRFVVRVRAVRNVRTARAVVVDAGDVKPFVGVRAGGLGSVCMGGAASKEGGRARERAKGVTKPGEQEEKETRRARLHGDCGSAWECKATYIMHAGE